MAFWGLITALSRPVTMGFDAWPEFAMRVANCALPIMLYFLFRKPKELSQEINQNDSNMEMTYD